MPQNGISDFQRKSYNYILHLNRCRLPPNHCM